MVAAFVLIGSMGGEGVGRAVWSLGAALRDVMVVQGGVGKPDISLFWFLGCPGALMKPN